MKVMSECIVPPVSLGKCAHAESSLTHILLSGMGSQVCALRLIAVTVVEPVKL